MKKLAKNHKRVMSSDYPPAAKQAEHDAIHIRGADDPDVQDHAAEYFAESAENRRQFGDVMLALKHARETAGLSLSEVAARSEINKSNLSLLENGKGNPTIGTVRRIAEAIGVEITVQVSEPAAS